MVRRISHQKQVVLMVRRTERDDHTSFCYLPYLPDVKKGGHRGEASHWPSEEAHSRPAFDRMLLCDRQSPSLLGPFPHLSNGRKFYPFYHYKMKSKRKGFLHRANKTLEPIWPKD